MAHFQPTPAFDGYTIDRLLGEGGMGAVYLATDTLLDRKVAIKFITQTDKDQAASKRFMIEARAIARLQHPNVVTIYRVGEVDGYPYLVSEFIRGRPLDRIDLPVSYPLALKLSQGVARALSAAHRRGVLHRDIKPANVILSDDGEAKLLDFGIAKLVRNANAHDLDETGSFPPASSSAVTIPPPYDISSSEQAPSGNTEQADMSWAQEDGLTRADMTPDSHLTSDNILLGTPNFMAPEVWAGEPASFRSDVYSFGVLVFVMLTGRTPHRAENLTSLRVRVVTRDAPSLLDVAPFIDPEFGRIIDRCLSRRPERRYATAEELRSRLERLTEGGRREVVPTGNPYRGLHRFEAEHQDLFFGRDAEIRTVLERLSVETFVVVVGDSGVGKSSLCRAGVLPRRDAWFTSKNIWHGISLVPGSHPVASLSAALAPILEISESALTENITADPVGEARRIRASQSDAGGLLIFIDQLEELVTIADKSEAETASEFLGWLAVPGSSIRLLATARGDFLSRLTALPHIGSEIPRALFFVSPLTLEGTREAIVGPAHIKGVSFESQDLVETLARATSTAGGLPLLQFILSELWERRDKTMKIISRQSLDQLGGVDGALTRHADRVIEGLIPKAREAAKQVLLSMVSANRTRIRRSDAELGTDRPEVRAAVEGLIKGRLLVATDASEGGYEIAHEVLIHSWKTLSDWLSQDAEAGRLRDRICFAAKEWERLGRSRQALWGSKQLAELRDITVTNLPPVDALFLERSKSAVKLRQLKRMGIILAVPLLIIAVYGAIQIKNRQNLSEQVNHAVDKAERHLEEAESLRLEYSEMRAEALVLFDQTAMEKAESQWAAVRSLSERIEPIYREAAAQLELALQLDPSRHDIRDAFAELLFNRGIFAEQRGYDIEAAELFKRLSLWDSGKTWINKLTTPGEVIIETGNDAATVLLYHVVAQKGGRYENSPHSQERGSRITWRLKQGTYLAKILLDKRLLATYPFLLNRGKRILITLPPSALVAPPEGFVYIPSGPFLYGSAAEDGIRRDFFHTVPIHEVHTDGYYISRHETTFSDWIEYLNRIPEPDRESRTPRIGKGGFTGALSLKQNEEEKWQISFQPTTVRYTAAQGEKIRYQNRSLRQLQNWLHFPVFGISAEEAEQYAAWLDQTGRVRGARLCTDHEWEKAARGSDGREYPHGTRLHKDDANFDDTYNKIPEAMGPDEVGSHPASDSPFGIKDMAGNVWEWTRSSHAEKEWVARGGSYLFGRNSARVTDREITEPSFRDISVGMRLCADLPN